MTMTHFDLAISRKITNLLTKCRQISFLKVHFDIFFFQQTTMYLCTKDKVLQYTVYSSKIAI